MVISESRNNRFFILADVISIFGSSYISYLILNWPISFNPLVFGTSFFVNLFILILVSLVSSLSVGLYNAKLRESFASVVRRIFVSTTLVYFVMGVVVSNVFTGFRIGNNFIELTIIILIFMMIVQRYYTYDEHALGFGRKRIIIFGAGERASIIEKRMRRKVDQKDFELIGYVPMKGDVGLDVIPVQKLLFMELNGLTKFVLDKDIDCIVIACDERRNVLPVDSLFECRIRGVEIIDILDFLERETGQVAVNLIYPSWVIYSNGFQSDNYVRISLDYAFNVLMAIIVLLVTWPFMLITAILIYLEDGYKTGASIFYTQERVGLGGMAFKIYKFRSMHPDAELNGAQWAAKRDNRTTRIGAFIRKYRIDELPQLINIFKGEMGFVGPRPERPEFVKELVKVIPYYNQRHNVKPGLTGWAQLKYPYGSSQEDSMEKLKYDIYYIKHRSILFDLFILIRTVEIVLFGKGR